MILKEITNYLEEYAPLSSQESYDNCGLIVGNKNTEINSALIALDCTEEIIDEAILKKCNLVIVHHPIIFSGLKKLNGNNYIERTVIKAIENKIAIYAIHTNLDNQLNGVNFEIGSRLKLKNLSILSPKQNTLLKLTVNIPSTHSEKLLEKLFETGVGKIGNYKNCSFKQEGVGSFQPTNNAQPFIGEKNVTEFVKEDKIEVLIQNHQVSLVLETIKTHHPYEEVAYELIPLKNTNNYEGSGMVGYLEKEMNEVDFLQLIKETFDCKIIRHTKLLNKPIKKIAFCGGSGSFLLEKAKKSNADIFITGDYKYHDFFDAEDEIIIADIGHFESEQYTSNLLVDILTKKFPTFAFEITGIKTNPINYF